MSKGKPVARDEALRLVPQIEEMLMGKVKRMLVVGRSGGRMTLE